MKHSMFVPYLLAILSMPAVTPGQVIHVPADQPTIQAGIDSSSDGDTVLVEPGTYYENLNLHGKKIVLAGHYIMTGDYADILATVIDGSQPTDTDTASCVLFINGEDSTTVLEGFTLTGGTGTVWQDIHNGNFYREGGGILCEFSAPVIRNNMIVYNDASGPGGTSAGGGGIRIGDANPTVVGNVIAYNTGRYGGGIVLNYTGAKILNNVIYRNSGGADFGGSGVWIYANGANPKVIENNTIMENSSSTYGGGVYTGITTSIFRNNIVWANTAPDGPQISIQGGTLTVTYSDVEGGWGGTGNIDADPAIGDTTHRLGAGSPCIDAGNPAVEFNDPEDTLAPGTALFPSMGGLRNDMGAFGGPLRGLVYLRIHRNAPVEPSGFTAYSDYSTPGSIDLTWNDPTELFNGDPIPAFTLRLYRDSSFLATVGSGVEAYTDTGLTLHQPYSYTLYAVTAIDSSPAVGATAYAGGNAVPAPPTALTPTDGPDGCTIGWTTPSTQIDGTPLNDLAMAYIYRDGALIDSIPMSAADTGAWRVYPDTAMGYHSFRVRVRDDEIPVNFSASTDSVLGFGGLADHYSEDFEAGPGYIARTGSWDTTASLGYASGHSLTDSPSGTSAISSTTYATLPPVRLDGRYRLEYRNIAIIRGGQLGYVEISTDKRKTFHALRAYNAFLSPGWLDGTADSSDWIRFSFDLSVYDGDTATIRFKLQTSPLDPWDGWYIDDVLISRADPDTGNAINVPAGWGMASLPVETTGPLMDVFTGARPNAFRYDLGYRRVDTVSPGVGYWLSYDSSSSPVVSGTLIPADTIQVKTAWNMIGTIGYPIDSSAVRTQPSGIIASSFYSYDPDSGYVPSPSLLPGRAYWVRVSAPGKIILSIFYPSAAPKSGVAGGTAEPLSELEFTDAGGRRGTLRYGTAGTDALPVQLPPPPPAGAFDLRYASGLSVERVAPDESKEVPILHGALEFPVTVRWRPAPGVSAHASLGLNGESIQLDAGGERVVSSFTRPPVLRLSGESPVEVPAEFILAGNYPNPFNPVTRISFALPEARFVTITVFDLLGREVASLGGSVLEPGWHSLTWDATATAGGVYLYRISAGNNTATGKMILVK